MFYICYHDSTIKSKREKENVIMIDKVNSQRIVITIKKDLKEQLVAQAQKENRTMSNLVIKIITDYLNAQAQQNK